MICVRLREGCVEDILAKNYVLFFIECPFCEGCVEDILAKNYVLFFIECPFSLLGILCSMMSE